MSNIVSIINISVMYLIESDIQIKFEHGYLFYYINFLRKSSLK